MHALPNCKTKTSTLLVSLMSHFYLWCVLAFGVTLKMFTPCFLGSASCDVGCMVSVWSLVVLIHIGVVLFMSCLDACVAFFLGVVYTYGFWWLLHVAGTWRVWFFIRRMTCFGGRALGILLQDMIVKGNKFKIKSILYQIYTKKKHLSTNTDNEPQPRF